MLGSIAAGNLRFMVQAVNGVGLVTLDDNNGAYYRVNPAGGPAPLPTQLSLDNPPSTGVFGTNATVAAVLTAGGSPLAGKLVTFAVGSQTAIDMTDATGRAQASLPLIVLPGAYVLRATFGGTDGHRPSSDESGLTVTKQPTTLALAPSNAVAAPGFAGGITATLRAGGEPVPERTIAFIITGPGGPAAATAITDFLGQALLPAVRLPAGTYTVKAYFAGTIPFPSGSQTFTDPAYLPSTDTATLTFSSRAALRAVRDEIDGTPGGAQADTLHGAVVALDKAIDPALWIDGNHPRSPGPQGGQVFQGIKEALQKLLYVASQPSVPVLVRDRLQPWIDALVGAGRGLAAIAIRESAASPGVSQRKLADAQGDFARGTAVEGSAPAEALEDYRQAWTKAVDARK